jgi:NAD(P)-dependent dehydrogenase (short-subunit alcohol dehydrogenase family)
MRFVIIAAAMAWAGIAGAQEAATPGAMTAEQLIEKMLQASGGRAAMEKLTSTVGKGTAEITWAGITANTVLPGTMDTTANRAGQGDASMYIPPAQVAALLIHLVSDAGAQITGAAIPVYGAQL